MKKDKVVNIMMEKYQVNDEFSFEPKIEVIIPTLNEEKNIGKVIERVFMYADKVLVVDGNSTDRTIDRAKETGAEIIIQKNKGKGSALKEAFNDCEGEIVIILDGDGSMRPEEIPIFLKGLQSGADIVKGSRFIYSGGSKDITALRRFGNTVFVFLINLIWSSRYTDICYGYMAFKKDSIKKIGPLLRSKDFEVETEIIIKAKKNGLKIVEVPSLELKRLFGESKLSTFRDGFKILLTIFREIFA